MADSAYAAGLALIGASRFTVPRPLLQEHAHFFVANWGLVRMWELCAINPVFHLATLFARRKVKTRIRHRDWLKLAGEKIRRKEVGTVPTFLSEQGRQVENGL